LRHYGYIAREMLRNVTEQNRIILRKTQRAVQAIGPNASSASGDFADQLVKRLMTDAEFERLKKWNNDEP